MRHYYPLNTLTRVSGSLRPEAGGEGAAASAAAWLTLISGQPCGATTQLTEAAGRRGARVEVMLHRQLLQDDGRGLATGVHDTTVLTARLALSVGAELLVERTAAGGSGGASGSAVAAAHGPLAAGADAAHPEWVWAWATRAAIHRSQPVLMQADLADLRAEVQLLESLRETATGASAPASEAAGAGAVASGSVAGGAGGSEAVAESEVLRSGISPPADSSTHLAPLPTVNSEAPVARAAWLSRYATRFEPLAAEVWWLQRDGCGESAQGAASSLAKQRGAGVQRCDAYPRDLAAACSPASAGGHAALPLGLRQLCHHLAPQAQAHASGALSAEGLPPWLHILTLQVRDAVTDDVVLRLQNVGGPAVTVDVDAVLGRRAAQRSQKRSASAPQQAADDELREGGRAFAPTALSSWRVRTLTLNRPEHYLDAALGTHAGLTAAAATSVHGDIRQVWQGPHKLAFPGSRLVGGPHGVHWYGESLLAGLRTSPQEVRRVTGAHLALSGAANVAARFSAEAGQSTAGLIDSFVSQNTEEAGVFLSDAALTQMKADAAVAKPPGGRLLLAAPAVAAGAARGGQAGSRQDARKHGAREAAAAAADKAAAGAAARQPSRVMPAADRKYSADAVAARDAAAEGAAAVPRVSGPSSVSLKGVLSRQLSTHAHLTVAPHSIRSALLGLVADGEGVQPSRIADGLAAEASAVLAEIAPEAGLPAGAERAGGHGEGSADEAHDDSGGVAKHPRDEGKANLLGLIASVVVDPQERQALLAQVRAGKPLTAAQDKRLFKLSREPHRQHTQAEPSNLPELLEQAAAPAGGQTGAASGGKGGISAGRGALFGSPDPSGTPRPIRDSYYALEEGAKLAVPDAEGDEAVTARQASWELPTEEAPEANAAAASAAAAGAGKRGTLRGGSGSGATAGGDGSGRAAAAAPADPWAAEEAGHAGSSDMHSVIAALQYHAGSAKRRGGAAAAAAARGVRDGARRVWERAVSGGGGGRGEAPPTDSLFEDASAHEAVIGDPTAAVGQTDGDSLVLVAGLGVLCAACLFCCCGGFVLGRRGARPRRGAGGVGLAAGSGATGAAAGGEGTPGGAGDDDDAFTADGETWLQRAAGVLAYVGLLGPRADPRRAIIKRALNPAKVS
jgi:hypothetical protein